jgi:hypothetical protein
MKSNQQETPEEKYSLYIHHRNTAVIENVTGQLQQTKSSGHFYLNFQRNSDKTFFGKHPSKGNLFFGKAEIRTDAEELTHYQLNDDLPNQTGKKHVDTVQIDLTKEQYDKGLGHAKAVSELKGGEYYVIGFADCVDFVQSVYHAAGLPFYFTQVYSRQQLKDFGTLAADKALADYGSRDTTEEHLSQVEEATREQLASKLNINVDKIIPSSSVLGHNPDSSLQPNFKISLPDSDLLPTTSFRIIDGSATKQEQEQKDKEDVKVAEEAEKLKQEQEATAKAETDKKAQEQAAAVETQNQQAETAVKAEEDSAKIEQEQKAAADAQSKADSETKAVAEQQAEVDKKATEENAKAEQDKQAAAENTAKQEQETTAQTEQQNIQIQNTQNPDNIVAETKAKEQTQAEGEQLAQTQDTAQNLEADKKAAEDTAKAEGDKQNILCVGNILNSEQEAIALGHAEKNHEFQQSLDANEKANTDYLTNKIKQAETSVENSLKESYATIEGLGHHSTGGGSKPGTKVGASGIGGSNDAGETAKSGPHIEIYFKGDEGYLGDNLNGVNLLGNDHANPE